MLPPNMLIPILQISLLMKKTAYLAENEENVDQHTNKSSKERFNLREHRKDSFWLVELFEDSREESSNFTHATSRVYQEEGVVRLLES